MVPFAAYFFLRSLENDEQHRDSKQAKYRPDQHTPYRTGTDGAVTQRTCAGGKH